MLERIGASNPFPPGVAVEPGTLGGVEASSTLGDPTWVAELPEGFDASRLASDLRPPVPAAVRGISDGTMLLYSPLDTGQGSQLGIYRAVNGELVWTTRLPPNVYPLSDSQRLYLIDHRSDTQTNIAVIAPSRAQITACFAATGSPVPRPSPIDRTAVVSEGSLFVLFPVDGFGARIEKLGDLGVQLVADNRPYPHLLHGVLRNNDRSVLVTSSGSQGSISLTGYDLESGAPVFSRTGTDLRNAAIPSSWRLASQPSLLSVASSTQNQTLIEIRGSLISGENLLLFAGTETESLMLVMVGIDGLALWRAGIVPQALSGTALSNDHVYITSTVPPVEGESRASAVLDAVTGEWVGQVPNLRSSAPLGSDLIGFSVWKNSRNELAVIYDAGVEFGYVGGAAVSNVEPLALDPAIIVVYVEVGSRRLIVAYVLDPGAVEGPTQ